jgi:hypothetical protein
MLVSVMELVHIVMFELWGGGLDLCLFVTVCCEIYLIMVKMQKLVGNEKWIHSVLRVLFALKINTDTDALALLSLIDLILCGSVRESILALKALFQQITAMFGKMTNLLLAGVDMLPKTSTELLQVTLCSSHYVPHIVFTTFCSSHS